MNFMNEALEKILDETSVKVELDPEVNEEFINEEFDTIEDNVIDSDDISEGDSIFEYITTDALVKRATDMGVKSKALSTIQNIAKDLKKAGSIYYGLESMHASKFGAVASFRKENEESSSLNVVELKALAGNIASIRWVRFRYGTLTIGLVNK